MDELRVLLFFAALCVYILLAASRGLNPSLAPLVAVCFTALWATAFGMLGLLQAGGWLYYLLAAAGAVWLWRQALVKKQKICRLEPGLLLFLVCSLALIAILWARQPEYFDWDEFSFWGTAVKLTKFSNRLHPAATIGWGWPSTQVPVLTSFAYMLQFLGSGFHAWQTYAAYNILQVAALAALLAPFGRRQWAIAAPVGVAALLVPFAFTVYAAPRILSVYLGSLADIPMGLLFGAALALYAMGWHNSLRRRWPLLLVLLTLTLTKEPMGPVLALLAAVVFACDTFFARGRRPLGRRLGRAAALFGVCALVVGGAFLGWSLYRGAVAKTAVGGLGGVDDTSVGGLVGSFFADLLGPGSEKYNAIMGGMPGMYLHGRINMFGTGLTLTLLTVGLLVLAALITRSPALRRRSLVFAGAGTLCLLAYHLVLALAYIYIFRDDQLFEGFERYVYPYYIGWFLAALVLLGMAAKRSRFAVKGRLALLALCGVLLLQVARYVPPVHSVLGFHGSEFNDQRRFGEEIRAYTAYMQADDLTFVVTDDNGLTWFRICYELLPYQVDYSFGGELWEQVEDVAGGTTKIPVDAERLAAYLAEKGCTLLWVYSPPEGFAEEFAPLFAEDLTGERADLVGLYRIGEDEAGLRLYKLA